MDNADKFADKWNFKKVKYPQTLANAGGLAGARTPDHLIKSPMTQSNISDLSPKTVWTSVDISLKCRQSVDKMWTNRKERHGKI